MTETKTLKPFPKSPVSGIIMLLSQTEPDNLRQLLLKLRINDKIHLDLKDKLRSFKSVRGVKKTVEFIFSLIDLIEKYHKVTKEYKLANLVFNSKNKDELFSNIVELYYGTADKFGDDPIMNTFFPVINRGIDMTVKCMKNDQQLGD